MCQKFDIKSCNQTVGVASVIKGGLYYNIQCRCKLNRPGIYKLRIYGVSGSMNLGTCLPEGDSYILEKRIPVKSIGDDIRGFQIYPTGEGMDQDGIPVAEDRPFEKLAGLRRSKLIKMSGKMLIQLFGEAESNQNGQADRTVVGSHDISIDRGLQDSFRDS